LGLPRLLLSLVVRRARRGLPGEGRELAQERDGVMAEPLAVLPDRRVQFVALGLAPRAGAVAVPAATVPAVAAVVAPPGPAVGPVSGHAEQGQAAGPAGTAAAEQGVMPGVVPEGQRGVPHSLRRCLVQGCGVAEGRPSDDSIADRVC
jgi:hypothetical protein